jgi:hypothetical protein
LRLVDQARLAPPTYGKVTTSVMSYGHDLMPCHFATG